MLEIRPTINSAVEEVFGFKTCCGVRAYDQNLEIFVTNHADHPVEVHSYFDVQHEGEWQRIPNLMPSGLQRIEPGQTIAFYCTMDPCFWEHSQQMIFHDAQGNHYSVNLA